MQRIQILKFLALLISSTVWSAPSFGAPSPCPSKKQEAQGVTSLQDTLEHAYMQNAELDAARAGLRATDETVSQANADWRPSLSVQGTQTQNMTYPIGPGFKNESNVTGYTARIDQNIYKGGATVAAIGQAESNVFSQKAGLFTTEQDVLLKAIQAHTAIVGNEAIVRYQQASQEFSMKQLERAQAKFEVGEGSRTDVAIAQAEFESALADVAAAQGQLETSKANYAHQVGNVPGKLAAGNIILNVPTSYEEVLCVAKTHNPLITQAKYALEAAEYNVDLQFAELLPKVDVQSSVGNTRQSGTTGVTAPSKTTNLQFGAAVNIPIYLQGKPNSRIRQAYQQVAQQKVLLVNSQRQVVENARIAWEALVTARSRIKSLTAAVKAQELAVEGAVEEYNVGVKSIVDVFVEREKLTNIQIDLTNAEQELIVASYAVLQAMGRLTACDLKLRVKYYDPDAYYNEYKEAWIQFWQDRDYRYVKDGA